jgi:hypothetical protein
MEYRILNAVSLYFREVHVIGTENANWLKYSRHCSSFTDIGKPFMSAGQSDAEKIDNYAKANNIACILPTCGHTTRFLATYPDRFETPCFPVHRRAAFDLLDDKLAFHRFCLELGLPVPTTQVFGHWSELRAMALAGGLVYPFIVKPSNLDGSFGVRRINGPDDLPSHVGYSPIVVQEFIPGRDVCAFYMCRSGEIIGQVAYTFAPHGIRFVQRPNIDAYGRAIAARLGLDGVVGFDLRERADGQVFFIESNPRFWFRLDVMALAGLNFVSAALTKEGLGKGPPDGFEVRNRGRLLREAIVPWRLNWLERRVLFNLLSDPLLPLLELLAKTRFAGPVTPRDQSVIPIPANLTPY